MWREDSSQTPSVMPRFLTLAMWTRLRHLGTFAHFLQGLAQWLYFPDGIGQQQHQPGIQRFAVPVGASVAPAFEGIQKVCVKRVARRCVTK